MSIDKSQINWTDPKSKVSEHFTVHECTYLPKWDIHHIPSEIEQDNILKTVEKMELIREFLGKPIHVHCWIRPVAVNAPKSQYNGKNYNAVIGGAPLSAHVQGLAVDFHASGYMCSDIRVILLPQLEKWNIRMENIEGNWIHIDLYPVGKSKNRFFRP